MCLINNMYLIRGSRSLQNLVAISQKYCQLLLTIKAGYMGSNGKNWLLNPKSSSQSEGYRSKWLIWLLVREPLLDNQVHLIIRVYSNIGFREGI